MNQEQLNSRTEEADPVGATGNSCLNQDLPDQPAHGATTTGAYNNSRVCFMEGTGMGDSVVLEHQPGLDRKLTCNLLPSLSLSRPASSFTELQRAHTHPDITPTGHTSAPRQFNGKRLQTDIMEHSGLEEVEGLEMKRAKVAMEDSAMLCMELGEGVGRESGEMEVARELARCLYEVRHHPT